MKLQGAHIVLRQCVLRLHRVFICPLLQSLPTIKHQLESPGFYPLVPSGRIAVCYSVRKCKSWYRACVKWHRDVEANGLVLVTSFLILFPCLASLPDLYSKRRMYFPRRRQTHRHISDEVILALQYGGSWFSPDGRLLCPFSQPGQSSGPVGASALYGRDFPHPSGPSILCW